MVRSSFEILVCASQFVEELDGLWEAPVNLEGMVRTFGVRVVVGKG